jgi:hypothetical protein
MFTLAPTILNSSSVTVPIPNYRVFASKFDALPPTDLKGHVLTQQGGPITLIGGAIKFNPANPDSVSNFLYFTLQSDELLTGDFTLNCRVKFLSAPAIDTELFCIKPSPTTNSVELLFEVAPSDLSIRGVIRSGATNHVDFNSSPNSVIINAFQDLSLRAVGSTLSIFVDGVVKGSATIIGTRAPSATTAVIGALAFDPAPVRGFSGIMESLTIDRFL